jgi:hypothetical protein
MGGEMFGNCDMGSVTIANMPMKIITSETVMAKTGLLMNKENMCTGGYSE